MAKQQGDIYMGVTLKNQHWFSVKAIQFGLNSTERRPDGINEFLVMCWNADIFYGNVPFLKSILMVNIVFLLGVSAWLTR